VIAIHDILCRLTFVVTIICLVITFFTYKDYQSYSISSCLYKTTPIFEGIAVYSMVIALLLLVVETPVCNCFSSIKTAKDHWLLSPFMRGIIYFGLSIPMFIYLSPQIASGAFLVLTSLLQFMAQCQKSQDAADQARVSSARGGLKQPLSGQV
jgi:fucose permease